VATGVGVLNVAAALDDHSAITGEALLPMVAQKVDGSKVLLERTELLWGHSLVG